MSTSSLAFVPRIVTKHAKPWHGISTFSLSPPPDPTTDDELEHDEHDDGDALPSSDKGKGKERVIESAPSKHSTLHQDIASLISLALSDYNIWLDADLRQKLDACLTDDTGFVPINYLLRRAPFHGSLSLTSGQPDPSETEVVKALRTHADHVLEVRMRSPSFGSSSSVWYGTGKTSRKKDVGGYEVRRKDWSTSRERLSCGWTCTRWDTLTLYMEGIPPQYRTVGGIARFVETLLSTCSKSETDMGTRSSFYVQNVTLPPHYLDKPGDTPKCRGYALITLSTKSHLETILDAWPWKRRNAPAPGDADENVSLAVKDAFKYGLRTLSKARWDALNEEYLLYKQSLVDEMMRSQPEVVHSGDIDIDTMHKDRDSDGPGEPTAPSHPPTQNMMYTTTSSPYPFDCLVFVRHVHPETNKTTLRSLFSRECQDRSAGLDYVDFSKGMDTCYLRVASPPHATRLITYFGARHAVQADGLDAVGRAPVGDEKPIAMELIQGKKEELYWEKVPEKVRRLAVDKAVKEKLIAGTESSGVPSKSMHPNGVHGTGRKKRKRDT